MRVIPVFVLLTVVGCAKPKPGGDGLPSKNLAGFTVVLPEGAKMSAKDDDRTDIEHGDLKLQVGKPKQKVDAVMIASMKAAGEKKPSFKRWVVDEPDMIIGEDPAGRFGIMSFVGDTGLTCSGRLEGASATAEKARELGAICKSIKTK